MPPARPPATAPAARAKPLKRPTQARARFTVAAIFEAFVRIWQRDGWPRLTTRAVALEAGIAVGTLYEYFPSKAALLSGYVRHCIEGLGAAVDAQAVAPAGLPWRERIHRLLGLLCGGQAPVWFHRDMLALESQIAEPHHQRRASDEMQAMWQRVLDACTDLPHRPAPATVQALHLAVWGGQWYVLLLDLEPAQAAAWAATMEQWCCAVLAGLPPPPATPGPPGG